MTFIPYNTGTITAVNGQKNIDFVGSGDMTILAIEGSMIVINNKMYFIASAIDADTVTLTRNFAEASASGLTYEMVVPGNTPAQTTTILRLTDYIKSNTVPLALATAPNAGIGIDGQSALVPNGSSTVDIYVKAAGSWTLRGFTATKASVGLGNVDNTSDANKPVSTAQQTALDLKATVTAVNAKADASAVATALGTKADLVTGKVPVGQLPDIDAINFSMGKRISGGVFSSAVSFLEFILPDGFDNMKVILKDLVPSGAATLYAIFSANKGSSYFNSTFNYAWNGIFSNTGGLGRYGTDTYPTNAVALTTGNYPAGGAGGLQFEVEFGAGLTSAAFGVFNARGGYVTSGSGIQVINLSGYLGSNVKINGCRIFFGGANINQGWAAAYAYK